MEGAVTCNQHQPYKKIILWPNFKAAADEKALAVNSAIQHPFLYQETTHQEAAQDEKDIHARPPEMTKPQNPEWIKQNGPWGMEIYHHQDGDAAHKIQLYLTL